MQIEEMNIDFRIRIAGEGAYRNLLEEQIEKNNIKHRVELLGDVDDVAKWKYLQESDIFILTSIREGSCIALREARFAGCILISSDVGDSREFIGDCGIVFPISNQVALNEISLRLCTDEYTMQLLSACSRIESEKIPTYTTKSYSKLYLKTYGYVFN